MQLCNIDEKLVKYIGEVNKYKFNKYTPGSKIKIISENKIKNFSDGVFIFYICMETLKKIHKNFIGSFTQMGPISKCNSGFLRLVYRGIFKI